jgi:hypothetical protein
VKADAEFAHEFIRGNFGQKLVLLHGSGDIDPARECLMALP